MPRSPVRAGSVDNGGRQTVLEPMMNELVILSRSCTDILLRVVNPRTFPHLETFYRAVCMVHVNSNHLTRQLGGMEFGES